MAIVVTTLYRLNGNGFWDYIFNLDWPSVGSYPANGEPLDFTPYINVTKRQPAWVVVQITGPSAGYALHYSKVSKTIRVFVGAPLHSHTENLAAVYTQLATTAVNSAAPSPVTELAVGTNYSSTDLPNATIEARATFIYR